MNFADSLSTEGDSRQASEEVGAGVREQLGDAGADLGFLFFSRHHVDAAKTMAAELRDRLGIRHLLGCTGESIIGGGREVERTPALALWVARLPDTEIRPFSVRCDETPDGFCFPVEPEDALSRAAPGSTVMLLGEPFTLPVDTWLRRLNEEYAGLPVIGGMASGAASPGGNLLLQGDTTQRFGGVGVVLSGGAGVRTVVSQGCRPVGSPMVITDCDRNVIVKLGGQPALTRLQKMYQELGTEDRALFQSAPHVGLVVNEQQHTFGPGDFLIRNVIGVDPEHQAVFVGDNLRRGQTVQFHVRDAAAATRDLVDLLEREAQASPPPGGGLIFSCNGRGTRLFSGPDHDVGRVHARWNGMPTAGFFAAGELGPLGGRNHLHGFTACVALFPAP